MSSTTQAGCVTAEDKGKIENLDIELAKFTWNKTAVVGTTSATLYKVGTVTSSVPTSTWLQFSYVIFMSDTSTGESIVDKRYTFVVTQRDAAPTAAGIAALDVAPVTIWRSGWQANSSQYIKAADFPNGLDLYLAALDTPIRLPSGYPNKLKVVQIKF